MQVRGFAIEFIEASSKIKEMLSCPELGFRFLMMFFVSSSSIGVNLYTVLSLLMLMGFEIWFPYRVKFIS